MVASALALSGCLLAPGWVPSPPLPGITHVPAKAEPRDPAVVMVFLEDTASRRQIVAIRGRLRAIDGVEFVSYRSRAAALAEAREIFRDSPEVIAGLGANPFPASLDVRLAPGADMESIVDAVSAMPGVAEVGRPGQAVDVIVE